MIHRYIFTLFETKKNQVPDTPPKEIHIRAISSHSLRIRWQPPEDSSVQHIIYYKICYREIPIEDDSDDDNDNGGNDEYFKKPEPIQLEKIFEINNSNRDQYPYEFILNDLKHWTQYQVEILAGTKIGDGPASDPIVVRTEEDGKIFVFVFVFSKKERKKANRTFFIVSSIKWVFYPKEKQKFLFFSFLSCLFLHAIMINYFFLRFFFQLISN